MVNDDDEGLSTLLHTRNRSSLNIASLNRPSASDDKHRRNDRHSGLLDDPEHIINKNKKSELEARRKDFLLQRTNLPPTPWFDYYKSKEELRQMKPKLRKFYENQNLVIESLSDVDLMLNSNMSMKRIHNYSVHNGYLDDDLDLESESVSRPARISGESTIVKYAIFVNFLANVFLLIAKIMIALTSGSLSVTASLVDSVLDFTSTVIVYVVSRIITYRSPSTAYMFPVGKNRLEPIGVLVFAVLMIVSFGQVSVEALSRLIQHTAEIVHLSSLAIVVITFTVLIKGLCWVWCRTINNSGVKALAQDAMNDVLFNVASVAFPLTGVYFNLWWIDAVGAILISLYIVFEWCQTALGHIKNLAGTTADLVTLQTIIYLAARFSDHILYVTSVSAYHAGDNLLVEIDIVMDEEMGLRNVHDLAEALQYSVESLPNVERAFVHSDYSAANLPGHRLINY